jgi:hypothetical protein
MTYHDTYIHISYHCPSICFSTLALVSTTIYHLLPTAYSTVDVRLSVCAFYIPGRLQYSGRIGYSSAMIPTGL